MVFLQFQCHHTLSNVKFLSSGYTPSNAFDNNPDSLWITNGAAVPGMQWIGFEFDRPVYIGSIQMRLEDDKPERSPSMIYVEASCEKYFKNFVTQWVISNPSIDTDRRFNGEFYTGFKLATMY